MKKSKSKKTPTRLGKTAPAWGKAKVQKILVTTDFSEQSLPAIRYALALGKKIGATVTLLHVVETATPLAGMESLVLSRSDEDVAARALTHLRVLARRVAGVKGKVALKVRIGQPYHEITLAAAEGVFDLVVIATHGHTGLRRVLLGSTAERVVRHAPCPVLTVPTRILPKRSELRGNFSLRQILVPLDFSKLAQDAVPYAAMLGGKFGAELILIHVVQPSPLDHFLGSELAEQTLVPAIKQSEFDLSRLAADLTQTTGLKVKGLVREGRPQVAICGMAKSLTADLIVLTTHGYSGIKHVLLGSTAERVVRYAPCPVLVVRELKGTF